MTESVDERPASPFARSFFLTGATASGKTSLGVELALELNAEIVSLDSMAIYRGMDVGSAKPTLEERRGVPHYMIDVVDPWEEFSVVEYMKQAEIAVATIERSGRIPLFVGGTPLYLKTMLFGAFESPEADPELRERLRAIEEERRGALWEMLKEKDPVAANRLHPNDTKRLVRALEVVMQTGVPISEQQRQFSAPPIVDPSRVFILTREREELYKRIELRVDEMMKQGFLEETRRLFSAELPPGATASKAVGYRELRDVLDGNAALEDAVARIKQLTRNFAKRQETWFRSLTRSGARRVEVEGSDVEPAKRAIVEAIRNFC